MKINRAYSIVEFKAVDGEKRIIEGIASTPTPDRMNDIVELDGMDFKLPLPFLYQHNHQRPIGHVIEAKKTRDGLKIKAKIADDIAPFITEAWSLIKGGLIRGLSIGFRPIEEAWNKETGGFRFIKTELFEISAVTIPANAEASILSVKSADSEALAAFGRERGGVVRLANTNLPGVTGQTRSTSTMKKSISEQIAAFEAKRAANQARLTEIVDKSAEEGRTLNDVEKEEHKNLSAEVAEIDEHLVLLREHEKAMVARAAAPAQEQPAATKGATVPARSSGVTVKKNEPKGIAVARVAIAMIQAKGNPFYAQQLAKQHWPDSPEVEMMIKAAVEAGDTTTSGWASQLVPNADNPAGDFIEMLRAATIIGRIPGIKRVPFNVAIPIQTAAGTAYWVGEAANKPVTSLTYGSVTLRWSKASMIIVITKELAKFSNPSAEALVRDEMIQSLTRFFDTQFVDPTVAAVANVSPASITNGITNIVASGTTAAAFRTDMNNMLNNFTANNVNPASLVLLMSATTAIAVGLMQNSLGVDLYPNLGVNGGTLFGLPVIVSENVGNRIIAVNASDILIAEDGGIAIDVSEQASVEMDTQPVVGESSPITANASLRSLWQANLIGLRAERYITWARARTAAVEYISSVAYVP